MLRSLALPIFAITLIAVTNHGDSHAQSGSAMTRLRPIGSASAVDRFGNQDTAPTATNLAMRGNVSRPTAVRNETAFWQSDRTAQTASATIRQATVTQSPVRQTVWMQSGFDAPPLADSGMALPGEAPNSALPQPGAGTPMPNSTPFPEAAAPPRALPAPGYSYAPSPSDVDQIPQPSLETNAFARMENCRLITPPSTYMAASAFGGGCGQVIPTSYSSPDCGPITQAPGMLPAEIPSTATIPPASVFPPTATQPPAFPNSAAPARSLITLGQQNYMVQVGQGLWGQPVAYVPGQGLRNWIRYIFP